MLGLCRALLRDPGEAEDAAQQVFLSAHRSLLGGAEPREPAAWLATIARNECRQRIGARMRTPLASGAVEDVAGTADPVAEALRRADLAALWRAIRMLPRQQREALLLRELAGLRYDELAAALAVSEPAVESLLFRARGRLRVQLKRAYAALSGASWLEPLAQRFAGGGAPAVATKAVALGLGAAAVTGGAVVAPQVLEQRRPPARSPVVESRPRPQRLVPREAVVVPVAPAPVAARPPVERERHESRAAATVDRSGPGDGSREATATVSRSGPGGGDTTREDNSGPGSGGGSGSGSSSGSGSDSSGRGGGDEILATPELESTLSVSDDSSGPGG